MMEIRKRRSIETFSLLREMYALPWSTESSSLPPSRPYAQGALNNQPPFFSRGGDVQVHIPDVKVATLLDAKHQPIDQSKLSDALRRQRLQMELDAAKAGELVSSSSSSRGISGSDADAASGNLPGSNKLVSLNAKESEDPWKGYVPPEGPLVG